MSEATIPIKELMEKTEQWLLGQGYKKSTLGFYRATWNRFLSYSASPAYSRETAEQFLLQYFGVDVHAIDQTLDGRMRHARRHMNALDEIFRTGTVCRRKVYGVASIDDDCFDKFFSDYLSYCKMQNFSRSWMDNTIAALRLFLLAVHTFAVHTLEKQLSDGYDPMVIVPRLAAYLGHKSYRETCWYIHLTVASFPELSQKLDRAFVGIIPVGGETDEEN